MNRPEIRVNQRKKFKIFPSFIELVKELKDTISNLNKRLEAYEVLVSELTISRKKTLHNQAETNNFSYNKAKNLSQTANINTGYQTSPLRSLPSYLQFIISSTR